MALSNFKKFGLIGYPLQYSLSPLIHNLFAKEFAIDLVYELYPTPPAALLQTVNNFFANGGTGLNITAPYKELLGNYFSHGNANNTHCAANTLIAQSDGQIAIANTDGIGFERDLKRRIIDLTGKTILILGAGGAVRGILPYIVKKPVNKVVIVTRDITKVAPIISSDATTIVAKPYSELSSINADVIIHAISANADPLLESLYSQINFKHAVCYDLNYGPKSSTFLAAARVKGASEVIDGLGMLVEQAAEAFYLWHKCVPTTNAILLQIQHVLTDKTPAYDL